jgi:hypothetical protein
MPQRTTRAAARFARGRGRECWACVARRGSADRASGACAGSWGAAWPEWNVMLVPRTVVLLFTTMIPAKSQPIALIVCPNGDHRARTLAEWAERVVDVFPGRVRDLPRDATRAALENVLEEAKSVSGVVFFCHGRADALGNREILLDVDNVAKLGNRVVIAVACHSARELGVRAISDGVGAYIGFDDRLHWEEHEKWRFGEAITDGVIAILNGASVEAACQIIRERLDQLVIYFKEGRGKSYRNSVPCYLAAFWNLKHLQVLGDTTLRLSRQVVTGAP